MNWCIGCAVAIGNAPLVVDMSYQPLAPPIVPEDYRLPREIDGAT
jgi:hypothetical protein